MDQVCFLIEAGAEEGPPSFGWAKLKDRLGGLETMSSASPISTLRYPGRGEL
jgi:hypothetical protein